MLARRFDDIQVTEEEQAVLRSAKRDGYVAAKLFCNGDFNEEGFLYFGRLEVLCLKGLLKFVRRTGESERSPGDVKMVFALAEGAEQAAGTA